MKNKEAIEILRKDLRDLSDRTDINFTNLTKRIQYVEKLLEKYHNLEQKAEEAED